MDSLQCLQVVNNLEKIVRAWITPRPKHAHKTLGRYMTSLGQLPETDRRIDIVPQNGLARRHVTRKHRVDALLEQGLPKLGVPPGTFQQSDSEFSCEHHHVTSWRFLLL